MISHVALVAAGMSLAGSVAATTAGTVALALAASTGRWTVLAEVLHVKAERSLRWAVDLLAAALVLATVGMLAGVVW